MLTPEIAENHINTRAWPHLTRQLIERHDGDEMRQADQALVQMMILEVEQYLAGAVTIDRASSVRDELASMFASSLGLLRLLLSHPAQYKLQDGQCEDHRPVRSSSHDGL